MWNTKRNVQCTKKKQQNNNNYNKKQRRGGLSKDKQGKKNTNINYLNSTTSIITTSIN